MAGWLSTLIIRLCESVGSAAPKAYISYKQKKRELQWDFILEAIGQQDCLSPDNHESGTVSLPTIELRTRLLQEREPKRANDCGVPAIDDSKRQKRIIDILREMVRAGKLQRCRFGYRWKI